MVMMKYFWSVSFFCTILGIIPALADSYNSVMDGENEFTDPIVFHANQFFVELEEGISEDTITALLTDLNSVEVWRSGHLNLALWEVISFPFMSGGETILDIKAAIARSLKKTKINNASLNIQQQITGFAPSGTNANTASCFDINDYSSPQGDSSITISILDTGISDISDNSDPTHNYNIKNNSGYDYVNNDPDPDDEHGHGSHIAGIIHSITHHSSPAVTNIKFDIRKTHDHEGKAFMSAVVIAMVDALNEGADIINMSFGYVDTYHDSLFFPLEVVMNEAKEDEVLVVVAAGNDARDNDQLDSTALPASFPVDVIVSVTSLNCNNLLSSFSNMGSSTVDIAVLGEQIPGPDTLTGIVEISGTSQAAAVVTAVAALRATQLNEKFHPLKIICPMLRTATHYLPLADQLVSSGKLSPTGMNTSTDTFCFVNNFRCQEDLTQTNALTGDMSLSSMVETDLNIESSQRLLTGTENTFDAGITTTLLPGFETVLGAAMQIKINGCDN
jgi:subtilisin family serine protease